MSLPKFLALCGSASSNSSCRLLLELFKKQTEEKLSLAIWEETRSLPHFDAELTLNNTPASIAELRDKIQKADAVLIASPEYVFSIPAGIKNVLEWCVATRVFANKPCGLITAAASGQKAHEDLKLILRTIEANLPEARCLLISGVKGKLRQEGVFSDPKTEQAFLDFCERMINLS